MSDSLCVTILTAHRLEYALETARAMARNLRHDGGLFWHVASDGDGANYIGAICDAIREVRGPSSITTSNAEGAGYGRSYNLSTMTTHGVADYQLPCEDDWILSRELDTRPIMKVLANGGHQSREEFAYAVPPPDDFYARSVRLGYLGFQWPMTAHLFKVDEGLWMALDPESREQHVAAGHPRIETVAYQREVGPWDEGINPGATELGWCQRPAARRGVVWPLTLVSLTGSVSGDLYRHIGATQSYRHE